MLGSSWVAAQLEASQEGLSQLHEWVTDLSIGSETMAGNSQDNDPDKDAWNKESQ
jgi:hypothetical protein